jgi:hypothetical protein
LSTPEPVLRDMRFVWRIIRTFDDPPRCGGSMETYGYWWARRWIAEGVAAQFGKAAMNFEVPLEGERERGYILANGIK